MKQRFLLGAFLVIFSATAKAQINKGMWTIGGGGQYSSSKGNSGTNSTWSVSPSIGYVFKENSVLGVSFNFGKTTYESNNTWYQKSSSYGIGAFYLKYFPLAGRFFGYGRVGLGYSKSEMETKDPSGNISKSSGNFYSLGLTPGFSYLVSRRIMLEASLNNLFHAYYNTTSQGAKNLELAVNASPTANLNLGIRFFLGGAKASSTTE